MKLKKLDIRGVAHHFVMVFVVLAIAIGGTYYLVASHADSLTDTLSSGQTLSAGQSLTSANGNMTLDMQTDGNLVVYTDQGKAVWNNGKAGTGSDNRLVMQTDGNLVVYTSANSAVWQSGTSGDAPVGPTITLSASPSSIMVGSTTNLTWSTSGTSGSVSTGTLNATANYILSCSGPGGTATKQLAVTVSTKSVAHVASSTGPDAHYSFTLLDGRTISIVNLSNASQSNAQNLVQLANNSTVTQSPNQYLSTAPPNGGDFDAGDYVVLTNDGLYWLSMHCRGGFLTGMWPVVNSGSGTNPYNFANIANSYNWAPNELLPGSEGNRVESAEDCPSSPSVVPAVGGEYFLAVPLGGTDASSTCKDGTFAAGSGTNDWPVSGTFDTVNGDEHTFSFAGTAGQEFAGDSSACGGTGSPNYAVEDCKGNTVHLNYTLSYNFWDASTTATNYNGTSNQLRVTTNLAITPVDYTTATPTDSCPSQTSTPITATAGINLSYLNTPMDSQYYCGPSGSGSSAYCAPSAVLSPMSNFKSSSATRQISTNSSCDESIASNTLGTLCRLPYGASTFSNVLQTESPGVALNSGQSSDGCTYETFSQNGSSTKGFSLLYPDLSGTKNPLLPTPNRVEFIDDGGANPPVISPENAYIDQSYDSGHAAFLPANVTQNLSWDIQMSSYASPSSCSHS